LYGSTQADEICGQDHTVNEIFDFFAVVHRQALQKQAPETGASAPAAGVEDHESLKTGAVISQLAQAVQHQIDDLLANGVVAASEVVRSVFLSGDQLLRVEQLTVSPSANLVDNSRLQIDKDAARHVLPGPSLREKGIESIVTSADGLVRGHLAIRLNAVLQAEKLPASVPDLSPGLSDVDKDSLTHFEE
jgi:hypothetical protein